MGELTDAVVATAAGGMEPARTEVLVILAPQVRLMVAARLSPTSAQLNVVDDLAGQALVALMDGLPRLETRTVAGLRAFASGVVAHKVADYIADHNGHEKQPPIRSLDSTVVGSSSIGPLWQFLSASGPSPRSAAEQAERVSRLMAEFGRLDSRCRQVITLVFFDQLSLAEVAEQMQISRSAASRLLIRALRALRDYLCDLQTSG